MSSNRLIITVLGSDRVGIVAKVTSVMANFGVNIVDISQTIMRDMFTMIMLAEAPDKAFDMDAFQRAMAEVARELGVEVRVQLEEAFRSMHRI